MGITRDEFWEMMGEPSREDEELVRAAGGDDRVLIPLGEDDFRRLMETLSEATGAGGFPVDSRYRWNDERLLVEITRADVEFVAEDAHERIIEDDDE